MAAYLRSIYLILLILVFFSSPNNVLAQSADLANISNSTSGNSASNWASLIYTKTNGRAGPSKAFKITWVYHRKYLPVKVLRRASQWTKIEDMDGDVLWMHNSVLTMRKTAIVISTEPALLYKNFETTGKALARLEPNVIVRVQRCQSGQCEVRVKDKQGWVDASLLWGAVRE